MCGRLNVTDNPALVDLCENLEIELWSQQQVFGRFKRAADVISIVRQKHGVRRMDKAMWWLLLDPTEQGFKPSKYTSFNTRYDKLNVPRSAGFKAYRHSRCVIPVTGFGETEFVNKKPLHYFDFTSNTGALLLGGLCREWIHKSTGELALSCSVITLPAHPKLTPFHKKASPLQLPQDPVLINRWLDESATDTTQFDSLLTPFLPTDLVAQQIDKPSTYHSIGEPIAIEPDN